jgi:hypothetical protein
MGKVLILDFDGVLNNEPFLRHQKNHPSEARFFDPKNIDSLNTLVEAIKFDQIVVSSSWKKNRTIEDLRRLLSSEEFAFASLVSDVTPDCDSREDEIAKWIEAADIEEYLVLDDMRLQGFQHHFYRTDPQKGLSQDDVSQIVASNNKQSC